MRTGAAAAGADAVKTADLQKALALVLVERRARGGQAVRMQHLKRQMLGRQQVAPALGTGLTALSGLSAWALNLTMTWDRAGGAGLGVGGELGLLAAG